MDNTWDSLASLNLDGSASNQESDPWEALGQVNPVSSQNTAKARTQLGSQDDNGLCQKFAEEVAYGKSGMFPSAIDAWNNYSQNGQAYQGDVSQAPSGSLVYFAPDDSNGGYGHVGIADGEGNFVSATNNGVEEENINDWIKKTGQTPLGYARP